ncbi:cytochrome P450 6a8-like [Musca vetustissima]|uniref:cytochrome P450 6a8-like n=1 Tax=Musca vetustissima TaxID=27455 RepID=UPI002AB6F78D|nr:cytochrome P450 6a8-like [Musca vetustissima]
MIFVPLLLITLPLALIFVWYHKKRNYWKKYQILSVDGSDLHKLKDREHVAFVYQRIYKRLREENKPYAGFLTLFTPSLLVADLDLLKLIYISEFDSFPDRGLYTNYDADPLSKNMVRLHGDLWRKVRTKLTPTFSSGRMRQMFGNVEAIGKNFIKVMGEQVEQQNHEVEIRDLCARFTTDVIGNVAFGLECNSLKEPQTEFRLKGDKAFYTIHPFMEMIASTYPRFFHRLGYKVFTNELIDFYSRIVRETVEYRERNQVKRNDFLDILIELKNSPQEEQGEYQLDMGDLIAQAFVFFIGGFETSSSTMSFALYELAKNPQVQEKARQDVMDVLQKYQGVFNYESLNEMGYIRQVVQETLRKHPVAPSGRRVCRRHFTFPDGLTIEPDVHIMIPVYGIHHDPELYPQPEIFRPERFSPEERSRRHPMAYLPFGAGPRTCIAERFGMMQTMMGLALLLKNFKFSVCERTPKRLNFDPFNVRVFNSKDGIYLNIEQV